MDLFKVDSGVNVSGLYYSKSDDEKRITLALGDVFKESGFKTIAEMFLNKECFKVSPDATNHQVCVVAMSMASNTIAATTRRAVADVVLVNKVYDFMNSDGFNKSSWIGSKAKIIIEPSVPDNEVWLCYTGHSNPIAKRTTLEDGTTIQVLDGGFYKRDDKVFVMDYEDALFGNHQNYFERVKLK